MCPLHTIILSLQQLYKVLHYFNSLQKKFQDKEVTNEENGKASNW